MDASEMPLILLSNDDGFQAAGLRALADQMATLGRVIVVAPERERSAVSHSISLHKPLRLEVWGEDRYWCSGTPTDCIYLGVVHLAGRRPDLVVSGINRGPNLAEDVLYSGTVAAAIEAALMELPAIAVSQALGEEEPDYGPAARLAVSVARDVLDRGLPRRSLLNLNVPVGFRDGGSVHITRLGHRNYLREVTFNEDPRGRRYYWLGGGRIGWHDVEGSDCNAIRDGHAALTPIHLDLTHHHLVDELHAWPSAHGASGPRND